jgi:pyruvate dehydrogenase E2 component (dihydrolipoamide acetyltransferase)
VDLAAISGSGPQGRVTKADLIAALEGGPSSEPSAPASRPSAPVQNRAISPAPLPLTTARGDQRIPLKGLRRKIAEKMVRSKFTAPHFTFVEEMDATELVNLRKRLNKQLAQSGETAKISFLPFICKALVAAFRRYPNLNSNFDEAKQELVVRGQYNFGIAAATEDGLTVPVVKDVDRLPIRDLANEISRLGAAARDRKLKMEELSGGTFTITSLGQTGGLFATPIINHPEVAILGVHKIRKRPVVNDEGEIVVRDMMYVSLSFDHRVIDGAVGAEFTYELIRFLQHPELLFLERG